MGTNYYLFTKNRDLVHKHFAVEHDWGVTDQEYEIVEYPQLGYQIHVCKLSWGWLPLFQRHKAFKTWAEFEEFYRSHSNHLSLIDEYDHFMMFDDFKTRVFEHAARKPEPVKWEYGCDPIEVKYHPETAIRRLPRWLSTSNDSRVSGVIWSSLVCVIGLVCLSTAHV